MSHRDFLQARLTYRRKWLRFFEKSERRTRRADGKTIVDCVTQSSRPDLRYSGTCSSISRLRDNDTRATMSYGTVRVIVAPTRDRIASYPRYALRCLDSIFFLLFFVYVISCVRARLYVCVCVYVCMYVCAQHCGSLRARARNINLAEVVIEISNANGGNALHRTPATISASLRKISRGVGVASPVIITP